MRTLFHTSCPSAASFPIAAQLPAAYQQPLRIGRHVLANRVFIAPMAGVTDRPFRRLCKSLGAGYAVSEMAASNALLWATEKTSRRINHDGEASPKAVQIAGGEAAMMAQAARFNVDRGADVIDINMGCPAKKVCNKAAGSALMQNEALVRDILTAVVSAVRGSGVPVTLKMRTGFRQDQKNALAIAQMAESEGIAWVTIHGRTREDQYRGVAEYETIAEVKSRIRIPVIANGDIDSPQKALEVITKTQADAVMIGRAAQGRPWLAGQIAEFLATGHHAPDPEASQIAQWLRSHLLDHYAFYGEARGVRSARKHIGWYLKGLHGAKALREFIQQTETPEEQLAAVDAFFAQGHA